VAGRHFDTVKLWSTGALLWEGMAAICVVRERWMIALLAHVICAGFLACAAARGKPKTHMRSALALAVWALCVPVLAPIGLQLVVLPALGKLKKQRPDGVLQLSLGRARAPAVPPERSLYSLRELFRAAATDPGERVAALLSLRHVELAEAVPLLRVALCDDDEDVRLLAHALLERRDKQLRASIAASMLALESTLEPAERLVVLHTLCSDHWQLAASGLVTGEAQREAWLAALDFGERAVWLRDDGALRVLLARITLHGNLPERARAHLERAAELGTAQSVLAPLRAQAAFARGQYAEIGYALEVSGAAKAARPEDAAARALWARRGLS
jgi:polysaccharide biosynthesis protein PelE